MKFAYLHIVIQRQVHHRLIYQVIDRSFDICYGMVLETRLLNLQDTVSLFQLQRPVHIL